MPRIEKNIPTLRIGRILDDFDELDMLYDNAMAIIAVEAPEVFETLPPKPIPVAIVEERLRRQLTIGKVAYKRDYMRSQRAGAGVHKTTRTKLRAAAIRELSPEEEAAIMAEVDRDFGGA